VTKSEKAAATNKKYRIITPLFLPSNEAGDDYQMQLKLATIPLSRHAALAASAKNAPLRRGMSDRVLNVCGSV
jgi:hypothetical protein